MTLACLGTYSRGGNVGKEGNALMCTKTSYGGVLVPRDLK